MTLAPILCAVCLAGQTFNRRILQRAPTARSAHRGSIWCGLPKGLQ